MLSKNGYLEPQQCLWAELDWNQVSLLLIKLPSSLNLSLQKNKQERPQQKSLLKTGQFRKSQINLDILTALGL